MKNIYTDLKTAIRVFANNGKYSKRGNWSIAVGGYDLDFEVYFNNAPLVQSIAGALSICDGSLLDEKKLSSTTLFSILKELNEYEKN